MGIAGQTPGETSKTVKPYQKNNHREEPLNISEKENPSPCLYQQQSQDQDEDLGIVNRQKQHKAERTPRGSCRIETDREKPKKETEVTPDKETRCLSQLKITRQERGQRSGRGHQIHVRDFPGPTKWCEKTI